MTDEERANRQDEVEIKKNDEVIKITITKNAEAALAKAIERINQDFTAGKVTRQSAASWLLENACSSLTDADIKTIRSENFNAVNVLAQLVKQIQDGGDVPPELRQLLLNHVGLDINPKKTLKSKLTNKSINDVLVEVDT